MGNTLSGETKQIPGPQGIPGSPGKDGKDGKDFTPDSTYFKTNSMWCANGELCSIGSNGINFASKSTGQQAAAGNIAYRQYGAKDSLDIIGAGTEQDDGKRKVKVWDHLDVEKRLTVNGTDILPEIIATKAQALEALNTTKQALMFPNGINLAANVTGQEANAGIIAYRKFDKASLDIVGAGTQAGSRRVKIYDELDVEKNLIVGGANVLNLIEQARKAAGTTPGPVGPKGDTGTVTANSGILVQGKNTIRLGDNVTGKEVNAGAIGYQTFSNALDIVGAGTTGNNRAVKIYDRLVIGEWEIYQENDRLRVRNVSTNISYDFNRSPAGGIPNGSNLWVDWLKQ